MSPASQVLFLNPDGVLASDALARMVEVFEYSETIGIVGGLLCNPDESEQLGGRRGFPTRIRAFIRAFGLFRLARFCPEVIFDFPLHKEPLPRIVIPFDIVKDIGPWPRLSSGKTADSPAHV